MQKIGALELFPNGAATPASYYDGRRERAIIVIRNGLVLHAYEDVCPHQSLPLTYCGARVMSVDGERLRRSNPGAEFAVADGRAVSGPGQGAGLTKVPITMARKAACWPGMTERQDGGCDER